MSRQLITHLRTEHIDPDGSKPCPSCSESFCKVVELARHLEQKHGYPVDNDFGLSLARLNRNSCYIEGCDYKNPHADALQRHLHQGMVLASLLCLVHPAAVPISPLGNHSYCGLCCHVYHVKIFSLEFCTHKCIINV